VTLGGGFIKTHTYFFCFLKHCLLLKEKLFVRKQDKALKDTFFLSHLIFQSNSSQKIGHQKFLNATRGGGVKKVTKRVTYYLNGPFRIGRECSVELLAANLN
jgi:hypothetical protein